MTAMAAMAMAEVYPCGGYIPGVSADTIPSTVENLSCIVESSALDESELEFGDTPVFGNTSVEDDGTMAEKHIHNKYKQIRFHLADIFAP